MNISGIQYIALVGNFLRRKCGIATIRPIRTTRSRSAIPAPGRRLSQGVGSDYQLGVAETELEMARRHVREGAAILARQRAVVVELSERGADTTQAETLLTNFEDLQRQHEDHLARLEISN